MHAGKERAMVHTAHHDILARIVALLLGLAILAERTASGRRKARAK